MTHTHTPHMWTLPKNYHCQKAKKNCKFVTNKKETKHTHSNSNNNNNNDNNKLE